MACTPLGPSSLVEDRAPAISVHRLALESVQILLAGQGIARSGGARRCCLRRQFPSIRQTVPPFALPF